jgi:ADP-ribose pyrophosphatase YjhB (NUDIX family)
VVNSNKWRLPDAEWKFIQRNVPVLCVDVLLVRKPERGNRKFGLIYRDTPHQGHRWCLIGGRLVINETFRFAVVRQVEEALAVDVSCWLNSKLQPIFVAEYLSRRVRGSLFDPRQHAVGLVFLVQVGDSFEPKAQGEALRFEWFEKTNLPKPRRFGFGQEKVLAECIRRVGSPR